MLMYLSLIETEGDKSKFEQVYHRYKQLMYYKANRILENTKDSEDVVHESFLKIIDNLEKIGDPTSPQTRSFVVIITENKAIDLYRRRHAKVPLPLYEDAIPGLSDAVEEHELVAQAITSLPEHYRAVLLLKYAQGYSTEEIAEILSISTETVKKRIQRARVKLQTLLDEAEAECL